jgi:hypothetical protein
MMKNGKMLYCSAIMYKLVLENVAPTHPTEFMMGCDAKNLYMAFRVIQNRDKVQATLARCDNIFNDD